MFRRRHLAALLVASAAGVTVAPPARADDPIGIEALSPEMLGALGGAVPPDVLAAIMAAAGGSRAAQSRGAAPQVPAGVDPRVLTSVLSGLDPFAAPPAASSASGGRVIDLHPDDTAEPHPGPERIVPRRGGGIVEVRHEGDPVTTTPPATVLPTVRVTAPRATRPRTRRAPPAHAPRR